VFSASFPDGDPFLKLTGPSKPPALGEVVVERAEAPRRRRPGASLLHRGIRAAFDLARLSALSRRGERGFRDAPARRLETAT
jgi:hypothetical protein